MSNTPVNYLRLMALMFLEFFIWGAWIVPISSYMNATLAFTGAQIGWICGASALGALISPLFLGYVADRFFATERLLAALHLAGAVCLCLAPQQTTFPALMTLIVIDALCYMPTLPLCNNLVFRHIDKSERFSWFMIGGTTGWIVAGLMVGFFFGEKDGAFFYLAGGAQAVLAVYCLTLPHTPPRGAGKEGRDIFGLTAVKLLKDPAFLVFAVSIPLVTISKTFYTTWTNAFLAEIKMPKPTALMTLCQVSELLTMIVLPWFIAKLGLKRILMIGMAVWALRFFAFGSMHGPVVIAGLLLHGLSYGLVVTGASIYAARLVPPAMSARAQSFISMLIFGVGMFLGAQLAGFVGDAYRGEGGRLHDWTAIWGWGAVIALAACILFGIGGKDPKAVEA
ncbi:MAG: MFS transporter [Kiritimatiellia bacterium]|jgi:nucleoside transporter|nr:MFS transporter [Kiritimatiellia bacterium]